MLKVAVISRLVHVLGVLRGVSVGKDLLWFFLHTPPPRYVYTCLCSILPNIHIPGLGYLYFVLVTTATPDP